MFVGIFFIGIVTGLQLRILPSQCLTCWSACNNILRKDADSLSHGIRVAAIAPGLMGTAMVDAMTEEVRQAVIDTIPFPRRFGKPEEFADLAMTIIRNPSEPWPPHCCRFLRARSRSCMPRSASWLWNAIFCRQPPVSFSALEAKR
ncbi:hypothetical protein DPM13_00495 [Paracoccus mutanolyticus]|uniref:3-hydroxyacyl-CoA dehydrogenase NAD binding domain-containing protein n=1 Tax=Paracoccus mutanolyticus TaxID=1499308 RepID=A0ABM6WP54_9RHOB|nr:hypothetical protein DPM13_00495 [Paracoccus mutanolyticus]